MDVVFCWHMHQPDYRLDGRYLKPWTWLHAIKDYTDMAAHLESVPGARAVVNFSPVLIEQLQDYPRRIRARLEHGEPVQDPVLDALAAAEPDGEPSLLAQLLRVNERRMESRFGPYARLAGLARAALAGKPAMPAAEVGDLLVWYVIAWLGESLRDLPAARELAGREGGFTIAQRRGLLEFVGRVIADILPRYRRLAGSGAAELSVTPYAHPILPLLLDFESAREAVPGAPLPGAAYPDGAARCDWHLNEARCVFLDAFGFEPAGCWPSEGALSEETLKVLARHHFTWTASGSGVLHHSLADRAAPVPGPAHLAAWRMEDGESPACFFRDDGLSDLIGFQYSQWDADAAVDDFVSHLERRREQAHAAGNHAPVLAVIMDGENAWEYYPENGWHFLQGLYRRLAGHDSLRLATFSGVLAGAEPQVLPRLRAGSWVHGSLSTWIGTPARNRAWGLLVAAKRAVDRSPFAQDPAVLRQLAICEASDWFWWLGEGEGLRDAPEFDALFRRQLEVLYARLGAEPPSALDQPLLGADTSVAPGSGQRPVAMRPSATA